MEGEEEVEAAHLQVGGSQGRWEGWDMRRRGVRYLPLLRQSAHGLEASGFCEVKSIALSGEWEGRGALRQPQLGEGVCGEQRPVRGCAV